MGPSRPGPEPDAPAIAALRAAGAQRIDPLRFLRIEALARRAAAHDGALRQALERRLAGLLDACAARLDQARQAAGPLAADLTARYPDAADAVAQRQADPDLSALRQLAARLDGQPRRGPLAELVHQLDRQAPAGAAAAAGAAVELKSLSRFRSTWARLSVDRQLSRSLAKVPDNPGPLNSQRLVLRALQLMQQRSPAYLDHFVSQVETLLWLEHARLSPAASAGKTPRRDGDNKRSGGRGKAG